MSEYNQKALEEVISAVKDVIPLIPIDEKTIRSRLEKLKLSTVGTRTMEWTNLSKEKNQNEK
jgi:hypothetical protein